MFRKEILRLMQRLLILGVLMGCLVLIVAPQKTLADSCTDCDWAFNGAIATCRAEYANCMASWWIPGSVCEANYSNCWGGAASTYSSCLGNCGSEYQPGERGSQPGARNSCVQSCDQVYWECHYNGGANTGTYQSCIAGGGDPDDCCYDERSYCLAG